MLLTLRRPKPLELDIGKSGQRLMFRSDVLRHFLKRQQKRRDALEAGGQLFARFSLPQIIIELATGPRRSDFRTRTQYIPDRSAEQLEIDHWHRKGLHYVGEWHTHPENIPRPSGRDSQSIRESFLKSKHSLLGFLLVIVGTANFPVGLYISISNAETELVLGGIPN